MRLVVHIILFVLYVLRMWTNDQIIIYTLMNVLWEKYLVINILYPSYTMHTYCVYTEGMSRDLHHINFAMYLKFDQVYEKSELKHDPFITCYILLHIFCCKNMFSFFLVFPIFFLDNIKLRRFVQQEKKQIKEMIHKFMRQGP